MCVCGWVDVGCVRVIGLDAVGERDRERGRERQVMRAADWGNKTRFARIQLIF